MVPAAAAAAQMRRGDVIFYGPGGSQHVTIYLGNGQMIEAPYSGERVRVQPVPWDYYQLVPLATRPGTKPNAV